MTVLSSQCKHPPDADFLAEDDSAPQPTSDNEDAHVNQEREVPEEGLLVAARAGDQEAFAVLVERHRRDVFRLAYRMLHDREEATDVAQEVFWAAWRGLPTFRQEASFGTWLYTITYHGCLRAQERQRQRSTTLSQCLAAQRDTLGLAWSAMQAHLAEQHWCQAIQEQVACLPEKYRTILVLRHDQDCTYAEIAQQLTMTLNTVKTHLFRARALLRERLLTLAESVDDVGASLCGHLTMTPDVH